MSARLNNCHFIQLSGDFNLKPGPGSRTLRETRNQLKDLSIAAA
jgi:hypothetical protein